MSTITKEQVLYLTGTFSKIVLSKIDEQSEEKKTKILFAALDYVKTVILSKDLCEDVPKKCKELIDLILDVDENTFNQIQLLFLTSMRDTCYDDEPHN